MTLQDILQVKGSHVHRASSGDTLACVVSKLVQNNCGSLVVCDDADSSRIVGIITERDILRACASDKGPLEETDVASVMSRKVSTGRLSDSIRETMSLMTEKRIRHLPIVEEDRLIGMISIGDVVKAQANELSAENYHLKSYIQS